MTTIFDKYHLMLAGKLGHEDGLTFFDTALSEDRRGLSVNSVRDWGQGVFLEAGLTGDEPGFSLLVDQYLDGFRSVVPLKGDRAK